MYDVNIFWQMKIKYLTREPLWPKRETLMDVVFPKKPAAVIDKPRQSVCAFLNSCCFYAIYVPPRHKIHIHLGICMSFYYSINVVCSFFSIFLVSSLHQWTWLSSCLSFWKIKIINKATSDGIQVVPSVCDIQMTPSLGGFIRRGNFPLLFDLQLKNTFFTCRSLYKYAQTRQNHKFNLAETRSLLSFAYGFLSFHTRVRIPSFNTECKKKLFRFQSDEWRKLSIKHNSGYKVVNESSLHESLINFCQLSKSLSKCQTDYSSHRYLHHPSKAFEWNTKELCNVSSAHLLVYMKLF